MKATFTLLVLVLIIFSNFAAVNKPQQLLPGHSPSAAKPRSTTYLTTGYRHDTLINNQWVFKDSTQYFYNAAGLDTAQLVLQYVDSNWVDSAHYISTYDAYGNVTSTLQQTWNGQNWVNYQNYTFAYNPVDTLGFTTVDSLTAQTWLMWDTANKVWDSILQNLYYDSIIDGLHIGNISVEIDKIFGPNSIFSSDGLQKRTNYHSVHFYPYKKDSLQICQDWDNSSKSWTNEFTLNWFWDNNTYASLDSYTVYYWDAVDTSFSQLGYILTYNYDTVTGNCEDFTQYYYSPFSQPDTKDTLRYYDNYNIEADEQYNLVGINWIPYNIDSTAYDNNYNELYEVFEYLKGDTVNRAYRNIYCYAALTGINTVKTENDFDATLFPNPATNEVNINFSLQQPTPITVNVIDLTGRIVSTETSEMNSGANNLTINTASLANGVYVVEMVNQTAGQKSVLKLMKQ